MPPVTVIPTCANLTEFTPMLYERLFPGFVLGYVGTVGTWYMFDETAACFVHLLGLVWV